MKLPGSINSGQNVKTNYSVLFDFECSAHNHIYHSNFLLFIDILGNIILFLISCCSRLGEGGGYLFYGEGKMVLKSNLVYNSSLFYPMFKKFFYFLKCWFLTGHPVFKYFLRRHHVWECFWGVTGCFWPGLTTIATKNVSLEFTGEIGKPSDIFYYIKLRCILL